MRDRRDPEKISQELNGAANPLPPRRSLRGETPPLDAAERKKAAEAGLDSRAAKFFIWLGNHFLGVTLVLTGALLLWAFNR
jgi:hypothetical protein